MKVLEHEHPLELVDLQPPRIVDSCPQYSNTHHTHFLFTSLSLHGVEVEIHHPSHQHLLECAISTPILCFCNACGKEHKGVFYHCTTCSNFTIHSDCAFLPKKLLIQKTTHDAFYHPHPLTISYSFPLPDQYAKYSPRCRVCNGFFYEKVYLWIYKCEKCMYYAHVDCATSRREPFMSILSSTGSGILVKNYDDADYPDLLHLPFRDQSENILKHLFFKNNGPRTFETDEVNLHQHKVTLVDTKCIDSTVGSSSSTIEAFLLHDPMKKIELLCNACLRPIMSMPYYKCAESCNFALHEWCTRLQTKVENHPGHPQHTLFLMPNVPGVFFSVFYCDVCQLPCNGFAYGCVECDYYVDVSCGFIPEKITHKAHPNHLLSRVKLGEDDDEICHICRSDIDEDCFSFSCSICDHIFIHPECALLLPETIRHKYDKHPMSLSYFPIENHKSEYFCEICEEEMNPHSAFYHCYECVQSVHSACAPLILRSEMAAPYGSIYRYVNVKFGKIHKTPGHQHPLSFIQGTASDGRCSMCGNELWFEMIFKCLDCKYAVDYRCCKRLNSS
ncbi:zinc finger, PHD-type [Artemisia annua]|uniref:Zinc finger, PHD-type n=1 Tax=Artemisia annua TaxID=35608 RepID=A0A2U1MX10_ARTAN|nr:zinc finger, PHD-type [Artemisia annua]